MKTIEIGPSNPPLPDLLRLAGDENLILRTGDGREFVLAEIDDFDREIALTRQNRELMDLLDARSAAEPSYTIDEARRLLELED